MSRFHREKKKSLKFITEEDQKRKKTRLFLLAFFSFVIVFGGLSLFILGYSAGFDLDKMIGKPEDPETTDASGAVESLLPEISGHATFLLACGADDGQTLHMVALVGADMDEQLFSVYTLDPSMQVQAGSRNLSLQEHYQLGGIGELQLAVEAATGVKADRYIYAAEKGFKAVLAARILPCAFSQGSKRSTRTLCSNGSNTQAEAGQRSWSGNRRCCALRWIS